MSILDGLFERRSVSVVPSPVWRSVLNTDTAAGVPVTPATALASTAVFGCIRILAETVASLPLLVYRRREGGGKDRAPDHPLYSVLHDVANAEMTSFTLRETLMGHVCGWGNCYAEIETNNAGDIVGLWPLRPEPERMRLERVSGKLVYIVTLPDKLGLPPQGLPAERVLHIRSLGSDGLTGYSPITLARQAIGLGLATEEFGARFFGNGAEPGSVLQHPGKLSPEAHQRLRESWEMRHQGLERSHRVAILEEGMKIEKIGIPPEDAQFLQTRRYQLEEVARLYRIPLHMLQDLERATFSNIEHQSIGFGVYTMLPWFARWEQEMMRVLLTPAERKTHLIEFLVDGLLRGDAMSRNQAYATGVQWGWLSPDDVRERENMNPLPNGQGQVYYMPLNMMPIDQLGRFEAQVRMRIEELQHATRALPAAECTCGTDHSHSSSMPAPGSQEERGLRSARSRHRLMGSYRQVYRDTAARVLRREISDVGARAQKLLGPTRARRDYGQFSVWLEGFYREHMGWVAQQLKAIAWGYGEAVAGEAQDEVGAEAGLTPDLERFMQRYVEAYASRHTYQSEAEIREALKEAMEDGLDPLEALEEVFEDWREKRPGEIADEETVRFNNALARTVYVIAGVLAMRWVAFGESCPYCSSLNGQVVGIQQVFIPAGTDFQPEGADTPLRAKQNIGHGPAHGGCDCMVMAA